MTEKLFTGTLNHNQKKKKKKKKKKKIFFSLYLKTFIQNLVQNGPVVSEKIWFEFLYVHDLGPSLHEVN